MKFTVVILSAGRGERSGLDVNKNLFSLCGKRVIEYSIEKFKKINECSQIILVVSEKEKDIFSQLYSNDVDTIIIGGNSRQESVKNSLKYIQNSFVILHDAARPLISSDFLSFFVGNITQYGAISIGSRVKDTVHIVGNSKISGLIDRDSLLAVQTPQGFSLELLIQCHDKAYRDGFIGTDDLSLIYKYSDVKPYIYISDLPNIKLTTKEDIKLLEVFINENRTK